MKNTNETMEPDKKSLSNFTIKGITLLSLTLFVIGCIVK